MRLLVTGGAGFIGSHFIDYELTHDQSIEIVNLDALTYAGNVANNAQAADNARYHFVHGSINNRELVDWLLQEFAIDHIVNFAAESHVDNSLKNPELFTKTNVLGTQVLLDAAYQANIQKFVQISTDEVYGTMAPGQAAKGKPIRCIPVRHTLPAKQGRICWRWRWCTRLACQSALRAARTTLARVSIMRNCCPC